MMRIASKACIVLLFALLVTLAGCAGTGFEKKATLMPDSLELSLMQERYHGDDDAWRGGTISLTWEFK